MDVQFKTAVGGYDKKAVDAYIQDRKIAHEKEVSELKANVLKLSETVKNLHTMREVNLNESNSTIDNLKKVNDELQVEITQLKDELETFRVREGESASRYESISRTLLEARESADVLIEGTNRECDEKRARTEAECQQLLEETEAECQRMANETTAECNRLSTETNEECERLHNETVQMCQEMRDTAYAECEELRRRTKEETDTLRSETEYNCKVASEETAEECEEMRTQARAEAYNVRMSVKRECESLSGFMAQMMVAVDDVVKACDETKAVADQAFPDLSS